MIYLLQLIKMMTKEQQNLFVDLFDDLSFEIDELGYKGMEEDLINEMMDNHLGLFLECPKQIKMLTDYILSHQGQLQSAVRRVVMYTEMKAGA